jgi:hypothetical protein
MNSAQQLEYEYALNTEEELAAELMEISNEEELGSLIANVAKTAFRGAKKFANSDYGNRLRNDFIQNTKAFARQMIPSIGRNVSGYVASRIAPGQSQTRALPRQIIPSRNQARRLARIIRQSAAKIASAPANVATRPLVINAIRNAARSIPTVLSVGGRRNGRYIRRGNKIILQ